MLRRYLPLALCGWLGWFLAQGCFVDVGSRRCHPQDPQFDRACVCQKDTDCPFGTSCSGGLCKAVAAAEGAPPADASSREPGRREPPSRSPEDAGPEVTGAPDGRQEPKADAPAPTEPRPEPPPSSLQMQFRPESGGVLPVLEACVEVRFTRRPCRQGAKATLTEGDSTHSIFMRIVFDAKEPTKAQLCASEFLRPSSAYRLDVQVREDGEGCKTKGLQAQASASYSAASTYSQDPPPVPGFTQNLPLADLQYPQSSLLSSIQPKQIAPQLWHLHQLTGSSSRGQLSFVMGLGALRKDALPHKGKDLLDQDDPYSEVFSGIYKGRWFRVGPGHVPLRIQGVDYLLFDSFVLTGIFDKDGKAIEKARFFALMDADFIKAERGIDPCTGLLPYCIKDAKGKDVIPTTGTLSTITNPLPFSIFLVRPAATGTVELRFYSTQPLDGQSLSLRWFTCSGSSSSLYPCSTRQGATLTPIPTMKGTLQLDGSQKRGSFFPAALQKSTYYKVQIQASTKSGDSFLTSMHFKSN